MEELDEKGRGAGVLGPTRSESQKLMKELKYLQDAGKADLGALPVV